MRVYEYSASTQKILCSIIDFLYSIQTFFFFFGTECSFLPLFSSSSLVFKLLRLNF